MIDGNRFFMHVQNELWGVRCQSIRLRVLPDKNDMGHSQAGALHSACSVSQHSINASEGPQNATRRI